MDRADDSDTELIGSTELMGTELMETAGLRGDAGDDSDTELIGNSVDPPAAQ